MKNKINKHTVNSLFNSIQFNSIQFNSIPKIISLIALLFLVSCSSNEEPEPKYLELVGLWTTDTYKSDAGWKCFEVHNNGNIAFLSTDFYGNDIAAHTNTKKIDDNFDYPYITKVITTDLNFWSGELTIKFESASKASVSGDFVYGRENYRPVTTNETHIYKKQ